MKKKKKICSSCNTSFYCLSEKIESCWCNNIQLSVNSNNLGNFKDCLCPKCLSKFKKK